ncbi:MAG: PEGA domain-containing protein, partial [Myxococcota bacterium]|nr:PEGA domain-containing protein [Myxococcota bacterium]
TSAQAADVYWRLFTDGVDELSVTELETHLALVLGRTEQRHLISEKALSERLRTLPLQMPACFEGLSECGSSANLLAEALSVDAVVDAYLQVEGSQLRLELVHVGKLSSEAHRVVKTGTDMSQLVREAVAELFTLEALISVVTPVEGAVVFVNGHYLGPAPAQFSLGQGSHSLRLEAEGYETYREELQLGAGEMRQLVIEMQPLSTQLTVVTAASDAEVWVDGGLLGAAGESLEVKPGEHRVELRAPGYRPIEMSFEIRPGKRRTLPIAMLREPEDVWVIRNRGIRLHRLYVDASYALWMQSLSFEGASGSLGDASVELGAIDGDAKHSFTHHGVQLSAGYLDELFGVQLLGIGFGVASFDAGLQLENVDTQQSLDAIGDGAQRIGVEPLHGLFRYLWGPFAVQASTGLGASVDSISMLVDGRELSLSETSLFWGLRASGRYYWSQEWYLQLAYGLELDFGAGRGIRQGLQLGLGFNLPLLTRESSSSAESNQAPDLLDASEDEALPDSDGVEEDEALPDSDGVGEDEALPDSEDSEDSEDDELLDSTAGGQGA